MGKNDSLRGVDFNEFIAKCKSGIEIIKQTQQELPAYVDKVTFSDDTTVKAQFWKKLVAGGAGRPSMHTFYVEKNMTVRDFNKYAKLLYENMVGKKAPVVKPAPQQASSKIDEIFGILDHVYQLSMQYGGESRILQMSVRSIKNCFKLAKFKVEKYGMSVNDAVFEALDSDYVFASQANMNPSFMNTYLQILREVGVSEPRTNPVVKDAFHGFKKSLIGMDWTYRRIYDCVEAGTKGLVLSGFHGIGKTTFFYDFARFYDCAEVFRVQVTETTNDTHLVGAMHPKDGFIKGIVLKAIDTATDNPHKKYMLLLDEYTRGRDEATQIILPLLAERKLIVNDAYAQMYLSIDVPKNLMICATGNVQDKGVRELGGAESDRWNGQHVKPINDRALLKMIVTGVKA